MRAATLVERLYARHAAGLPFLPIAGGAPEGDAPPEPAPKTPVESEARPAPAPEKKPAPAAETPPPPKVDGVVVSPEQMERFKQMEATLKSLQTAEEARAEEARKAEEARLIEEGKLKEVIAKKDEEIAKRNARLRETETAFKTTVRDRELAVALAAHSLVEGASPQLMKLWRDELEVVEDGDVYKTQTRDGKTVERFVAEALRAKEYAHFVPPASRGGAGSQGADRRQADPPPVDPNDRMAAQLRASFTARHENTPVALAGRNRLAGGNGSRNN